MKWVDNRICIQLDSIFGDNLPLLGKIVANLPTIALRLTTALMGALSSTPRLPDFSLTAKNVIA